MSAGKDFELMVSKVSLSIFERKNISGKVSDMNLQRDECLVDMRHVPAD